jgi:hypothetical protein
MTSCEYHNFTVINVDKDAQLEVCKDCGYKKKYNIISGRVNNQEYLKDHARDFAQPTGPTAKIFEHFYGKPKK